MVNSFLSTPPIILIAPNVSEQMGGEAMKALQIYQSLADRGLEVYQITHSRVRDEIFRDHPEMKVFYIEEDRLDSFLWKSEFLSYLNTPYFMYRAAKFASKFIAEIPGAVVHYTSPVSPAIPLFPTPGAPVIVGPLNGNIHHPRSFRSRETLWERLRRSLLYPSQWLHRCLFSGKQSADALLVAGGERTYESLRIAGCREEQFRESLDSGIPNHLRNMPLIQHEGPNFRFVHNGRLVPHKGTDLAIKAVARARNRVELDVIGWGPSRNKLIELARTLGVEDRVHFIEWFKDHDEMYQSLRSYRGFVFPSLAEANGIVVQEAMMLGLPVVCADWGGPALLVTPESGIAIPPTDEETLVAGLAEAMDRLGESDQLARSLASEGRRQAIDRGFTWADLIEQWITVYKEVAEKSSVVAPGHHTSVDLDFSPTAQGRLAG